MKRSDMQNKINDLLVWQMLNLSEIRRSDCSRAAESIMELIEEAGMTPPKTKEWYYPGNRDTIHVRRWESEDEKK